MRPVKPVAAIVRITAPDGDTLGMAVTADEWWRASDAHFRRLRDVEKQRVWRAAKKREVAG